MTSIPDELVEKAARAIETRVIDPAALTENERTTDHG